MAFHATRKRINPTLAVNEEEGGDERPKKRTRNASDPYLDEEDTKIHETKNENDDDDDDGLDVTHLPSEERKDLLEAARVVQTIQAAAGRVYEQAGPSPATDDIVVRSNQLTLFFLHEGISIQVNCAQDEEVTQLLYPRTFSFFLREVYQGTVYVRSVDAMKPVGLAIRKFNNGSCYDFNGLLSFLYRLILHADDQNADLPTPILCGQPIQLLSRSPEPVTYNPDLFGGAEQNGPILVYRFVAIGRKQGCLFTYAHLR